MIKHFIQSQFSLTHRVDLLSSNNCNSCLNVTPHLAHKMSSKTPATLIFLAKDYCSTDMINFCNHFTLNRFHERDES